MLRIGQGFDAHRFRDGGRLVLGGVEIPHSRGLEAHSDGDALLHAVTDALLGAIAAGDIGQHFPDTDPRWKGADSRRLLRAAVDMVHQAGFHVMNVDATLIAQEPRLAPHIPAMRSNLAADLRITPACASVKATTTEHMGFTGRREGLAAQAVVLLRADNGD
ncbi:MAG: 2-C-methyl-D-erythritol 2,4-cyclodiphosphate synthase [Ectothiorhodospiraceae bacterium]|nr:2-C-methyl-D-erythritol 2,4-cyclodiphosphate synthase [Ectothiorhodospiraceae bacterium]